MEPHATQRISRRPDEMLRYIARNARHDGGLLSVPDEVGFAEDVAQLSRYMDAEPTLEPHEQLVDAMEEFFFRDPAETTYSNDDDGRRSVLDVADPYDVATYHSFLYGTHPPTAWKTKVIATKEADVDPIFHAMRHEEFNGLMQRGMFTFVPRQQADDHRIYTSRFVDEIRNFGTAPARAKSRFV